MTSVLEILEDHGIEYKRSGEHHHVSSQGWVGIDCPMCSPNSGRYKLGINLTGNWCSCWTCGHKSLAEVLHELTGEDYASLRRMIGESKPAKREEKTRGKLVIPWGIGPLLSAHRNYLTERGFDPDHLEKFWGVRGIGIAPNLGWRIWIPITHHGETVSWTTRAIAADQEPRYVTARSDQESLPAKRILFGADHCRHAIVVCEGPFDAMRIGPGAAATMGTSITKAQLNSIGRFPVRVICLDAESNSRRAIQLCRSLAIFPGRTVNVTLESGKDAAAADESEIKELRERWLE